MALSSKNIMFQTDKEIAVLVGDRLRQYRVTARLTREDLTERMGVSLSTVRNIEKGVSGTIDHLISFLRATGKIEQIHALVEEPQMSPLLVAKAQISVASRVRKPRRSKK